MITQSPTTTSSRLSSFRSSPERPSTAAGTAVLSQSEAIKRFGTDQVLGRTFTAVARGRIARLSRLSASSRTYPSTRISSSTAFSEPISTAFLADTPEFLTQWGWQSGWVYLKLRPGTDVEAIEAREPAWEKRNIPDDFNMASGPTRATTRIGTSSTFATSISARPRTAR